MSKGINVTVWNESDAAFEPYPDGINAAIAGFLRADAAVGTLRTATLDMPEHGLSQETLDDTDVLLWWGHMHHGKVADEIVERAHRRVLDGMGLIVLHSAHDSKIFRRLMGTHTGRLRWRESGERERVWVVAPGHPIAEGLGDFFELPQTEVYGEYFHIPAPEELIFISWYEGGEVFRSGCTFTRGLGRIFYFSPGHETHGIYHAPEVQRVISNAVRWAAPSALSQPAYGEFRVSPEEAFKKNV
jgi:trehalose utilization protein